MTSLARAYVLNVDIFQDQSNICQDGAMILSHLHLVVNWPVFTIYTVVFHGSYCSHMIGNSLQLHLLFLGVTSIRVANHSGLAATILVTSATTSDFAVLVYKARDNLAYTVSVRRLPARCHHRAPPASIIRQFQVYLLEIGPSLLPDHAFRIVFPHMSIGLIYIWTSFT